MKIIFILIMMNGAPFGNNFSATKIAEFPTDEACQAAAKSVKKQWDSIWDSYQCLKIEGAL